MSQSLVYGTDFQPTPEWNNTPVEEAAYCNGFVQNTVCNLLGFMSLTENSDCIWIFS